MNERKGGFAWAGIILLLIGLVFLLNNFEFFPKHISLHNWWPVILIIFGFIQLISCRRIFSFSAWVLILLGVLFLGAVQHRYGITWENFWRFWPAVLVLLGLSMLFERGQRWSHHRWSHRTHFDCVSNHKSSSGENEIHEHVVLGGVEKEIVSDDFRGGNIEVILGSVELDISRSKMKTEQAAIDISAVLGNVELRIPRDWFAEVSARPVMGSIENRTRGTGNGTQKKLLVNASAVMGNIEIDY